MQTEMMPVFEGAAAESMRRLERERLANLRWESWGREIGLLTVEDIQRSTRPHWQWDDYAI